MTDPVEGTVRTTVLDGHILHIEVDRQAKRNAFTPELMAGLGRALTRLDDERTLWCGVLSFAGDHTTAGLDMAQFFSPGEQREQRAPAEGTEPTVDPFGLRRRLTKPLVTAIQGITFTVGIEIALAGDIVVAADNARLCQLEPKRGLAPLGGAMIRYVQRAGWGNAMYHLLRVDEFDAQEAYRIGLVQEVVPVGTQVERAIEIAREIAQNAPLALQATKRNAWLALEAGERAAIAAIGDMQADLNQSKDFAEGVRSFMERRPAVFTGE